MAKRSNGVAAPDQLLLSRVLYDPQPEAMQPILWPEGYAPAYRASATNADGSLPRADVLVVTWTAAEFRALADVVTPGQLKEDWSQYTHNFSDYEPRLTDNSPARDAECLGEFAMTKIDGKSVLCFHSELHLGTDGDPPPTVDLWRQIVPEVSPDLVITSTTDAIGSSWIAVVAPFRTEPNGTIEQVDLLRRLVPHLQHAAHIPTTLGELVIERDRAVDALQCLRHGIVAVNRDRRVLFANTAACAILDQQGGLRFGAAGALVAHSIPDDTKLARLVGAACGDAPIQSGGGMLIVRPNGRHPLVVHVTPLNRGRAVPVAVQRDHACALVTIVDPSADVCGSRTATWQELFGLTATEATVAKCVLRGEGLDAVADQLSVSLSTVRTHIQHVFDKTGTHRQAELVRLLLAVQQGVPDTPRENCSSKP